MTMSQATRAMHYSNRPRRTSTDSPRSRLLSFALLAAFACVATIPGSSRSTLSSVPLPARLSEPPAAEKARVSETPQAEKTGADDTGLANAIFASLAKAWKSGSAGFLAGALQVIAFMWLRTTMNYQYKFGGGLVETLGKLWAEGGIGRLYQGLFPWAIFQAPLSRFGDVATNDLVLTLMALLVPGMPVGIATFLGSMTAAAWRICITPVDTCKTVLQTDGKKGFDLLKEKVRNGGIGVLWSGACGNYAANVIGTYPWFVTFNLMQKLVPMPHTLLLVLIRSAVCGAVASSVSDVTSNSIRVIKTKKQTHADPNVGYGEAAREIIKTDGLSGVLFRGLGTRVLVNVMQGAFFTVLWKYMSAR